MYSGAGVFKTTDGGGQWVDANNGIYPFVGWRFDIGALTIDPRDRNVLYTGILGDGAYVTVDGGLMWRCLGAGSGSFDYYCDVALDPSDPDVIYSAGAGIWKYTRTTICAESEIVSYSPALVNADNCPDGCEVGFNIQLNNNCSEIAVVALERCLEEKWIQVDYMIHEEHLPPPDSGDVWVLTGLVDEHFADGEHEYRAVVRCKDGSREVSDSVVVTVDRGVAVAVSGFEAGYLDGKVSLHWTVSSALEHRGCNVYRSLHSNSGFQRLNDTLIPASGEYEYADGNLVSGCTYWYLVGAVDADGEWFSAAASVLIPSMTLTLFQNHPNPFNPSTTISFTLPEQLSAKLDIYNVKGELVATLVEEILDAGYNETTWDGTGPKGNPVSSGVYFYRLKAGGKVLTKKMVFLK